MDERQPPGIDPPEGPFRRPADDAPSPGRFTRLLPPRGVGRLTPTRRARAVGLALAGVVLAGLLARWVVRTVDAQTAYQLSYRDIILDPAPPPWLRGGRAALLDHALSGSNDWKSFSALDFDRDRLLLMFRLSPWVERAVRVEVGHPNRVTVRLEYREPVALERLPDLSDRTLIDREAAILPADEVDLSQAGPIIRLYGFSPPVDPRVGRFWSRADARLGEPVRDERVRGAARLSAFLRQAMRRAASNDPVPRFVAVHPWGEDGYSVQVGANLTFKWAEPGGGSPAAESPGRLSDEAKWAMLVDRVRRHPPRAGDPWMELKFTRDGVEVDAVHDPPEHPTRAEAPSTVRRAKRTRPAGPSRKASGG